MKNAIDKHRKLCCSYYY